MNVSDHLRRQAALLNDCTGPRLEAAVAAASARLSEACAQRAPILVCGNGGSAADALHIVAELVGRYLLARAPIRAIALCDNPSVLTAWSNDYGYDSVFSRQVEAHGEPGGVLWALSTSGNSRNVVEALRAARSMGMSTIGMTGHDGGACAPFCDILIDVPSASTPEIQQVHICIYHFICGQLERFVHDGMQIGQSLSTPRHFGDTEA